MNTPEEIAEILLEIKAITLNLQAPYRYTSGLLSPIYCDNRLIISYPTQRNIIISTFIDLIHKKHLEADVIAGTATAGIPHAALIADRLNKPMVYVRSHTKVHGKQNQIEGKLSTGQKALVVEDHISTGGSAVSAGLALRENGAEVTDCIAISSYQLETAQHRFTDASIHLHTLTDFTTLINIAVLRGHITHKEKEKVLEWNRNPQEWSAKIKT